MKQLVSDIVVRQVRLPINIRICDIGGGLVALISALISGR